MRIVTTSWDDGDRSDMKLAELLSERAISGTLYIPANGLVLAWISGISAALEFSSHPIPVWKALGVPPVVEVGG